MLTALHRRKGAQLALGLAMGIAFGFLLHRGRVTDYGVLVGQLLLEDFTVLKVMISAVITGMLGVHALVSLRLAVLRPKPGSFGTTVLGSIVFGAGFGILGYCPGTVAAAAGSGELDALFGGLPGIVAGAGLFAWAYPALRKAVLRRGWFGELTIPVMLGVGRWAVVVPAAALLTGLLVLLESSGL
jgi:uncharacterized protein